jgi:hypothetical protein
MMRPDTRKPRAIVGGLTIEENFRAAVASDVKEGRERRRRSTPPAEVARLRNEILCGLGAGLPDKQWGRRPRSDAQWLAQQFDRDHVDALVHWCMLLEAFGDSFVAEHWAARRKPRLGWPLMVRLFASLALQALQGADQLAGRRPRKSFGRAAAPLIMFVCVRLACILDEDRMPSPENILQRLKRTMPKSPDRRGPSQRKRT